MSMAKTEWIWMNGKLVKWDDATIHVMPLAITPPEVEDAIRAVIERNNLEECYIRPVVYRGYKVLGLDPRPCPVEMAIAVWPWGRYLGEDSTAGVDIRVSSWRRLAPDTRPSMAKAGANYMSSQLIKLDALEDGYAEAVGLDSDGFVSEGSERRIPRERLYIADEIFLTGTAAEITAVRSVDHERVGYTAPGPITSQTRRPPALAAAPPARPAAPVAPEGIRR